MYTACGTSNSPFTFLSFIPTYIYLSIYSLIELTPAYLGLPCFFLLLTNFPFPYIQHRHHHFNPYLFSQSPVNLQYLLPSLCRPSPPTTLRRYLHSTLLSSPTFSLVNPWSSVISTQLPYLPTFSASTLHLPYFPLLPSLPSFHLPSSQQYSLLITEQDHHFPSLHT